MNIRWLKNRLNAMSLSEMLWRVSQKHLERHEAKMFKTKQSVCSHLFFGNCDVSNLNWMNLGINYTNDLYTVGGRIELLGGFEYDSFKSNWHAGFQTDSEWPLEPSMIINAGDSEAPGDLRTNWELNRHHQFPLLAKSYYITEEARYLEELHSLFDNWDTQNPFLWGPEWTSPMEIAIRIINWLYCGAFLSRSKGNREVLKGLLDRIAIGCANMAAYILAHRSRYSSSNNHAIVEAAALGIAGYVYNEQIWIDKAFDVLNSELFAQNHFDGVNKEQSLHYQSFIMEAYALYLHVRIASGYSIPDKWSEMLAKCCNYVQDCKVSEDVYAAFGDDDEGSIFYLASEKICHPEYVISFLSVLLNQNYIWSSTLIENETLRWLFPKDALKKTAEQPMRAICNDITYADGGITIMRDDSKDAMLIIDHGPLGYGALAAHGHADALSFQLYLRGYCALIDPGTYLYFHDGGMRDKLRSTAVHNTAYIGERNQSEILGPFLWGQKAQSRVCKRTPYYLEAIHDGYMPILHKRCFHFGANQIVIVDSFEGAQRESIRIVLSLPLKPESINGVYKMLAPSVILSILFKDTRGNILDCVDVEEQLVSYRYGLLSKGYILSANADNYKEVVTSITWEYLK